MISLKTKTVATVLIGVEIRKIVEHLVSILPRGDEFAEKNLDELNSAYEELMGIAHQSYLDYHSNLHTRYYGGF